MSKRTKLVVSVDFYIPDAIREAMNNKKISPEIQEDALREVIFNFVQERFFVDEEEEIIEHVTNLENVIDWEEN